MPSSYPRVLLPLTLCLTACGGPSLAEVVEQEVRLSVSGVTREPATAALGESQGGLGIERAVVRASAVELVACREDTAELILAPRAYDLLGEPRPSEAVLTAVNELCSLRLDVDPSVPDELEGVPQGASLFVAGTDDRGEQVEWSSERAFSLVFEAERGASFGQEPLLVGFDFAGWLDGLRAEDGEAEALERFENQLAAATALYVDRDGDGELADDELNPVARAAGGE